MAIPPERDATIAAPATESGNAGECHPLLPLKRHRLDRAAKLANHGRFDEAVQDCERHLRLEGSLPSAYYLMGVISQAAGDRRRAEEYFRKTGLPRSRTH